MEEQIPDWKQHEIKMEPEPLPDDNEEMNNYFTGSYEEAEYQIPSSELQELSPNIPIRSILNSTSSLLSTTLPMPNTSQDMLEGPLKIKAENIGDEDSIAGSLLQVTQQNPSETVTSFLDDGSKFSLETVYIKMEDNLLDENFVQKEQRKFEFVDVQERGSNVKLEDEFVEGNDSTKSEQQLDFVNALKVETTAMSNNTVDFSASSESEEIQYLGIPSAVETNRENLDFKLEISTSNDDTIQPIVTNFESGDVEPNEVLSSQLSNPLPHLPLLVDQNILACERCSFGFRTESDMKAHLRHSHSYKGPFICSICSTHFQTKANLKSHLRVHSNEKNFSCAQCAMQFKYKYSLNRHLQTHIDKKNFSSDARLFSCSQCFAQFVTESQLSKHFLTHSNEGAFPCTQCPARFKRKVNLKLHLKVHCDKIKFYCEQCSTGFKKKAELKKHLLTHSDEGVLAHARYPFRIKKKPPPKDHLLTPSSQRPLTCNKCSAQFLTKANLNHHLLTHSDVQDFYCAHCYAMFKTLADVKQHLITHSDERPFCCKHCSARFKKNAQLKKHSSTHPK